MSSNEALEAVAMNAGYRSYAEMAKPATAKQVEYIIALQARSRAVAMGRAPLRSEKEIAGMSNGQASHWIDDLLHLEREYGVQSPMSAADAAAERALRETEE